MKISESTIERLAWWVVFLLLLVNIATFIKLTYDDQRKFKILQTDQDQLICVVKGFTVPQENGAFIDKCIERYQ